VSAINIAIEISSFEMRNNLGQPYGICILGELIGLKLVKVTKGGV
jgi:hypothetical protein